MRFLCVESHSPAEVEKVVDFIGQQQVYLNEERVRYGGHASSLPLNVWGETMQQGSSTAVSCCHVSTLYLTISDFFTPPWGRCWNRVHLSSLHTQLELTCAFIFARGWWVSPTQTFRPLRRLLSSSASLPISLPLFACAHSNHARFLFICFSCPPFVFHFLSFLSSLFLFSTLRPLSGTRQIVLSEEANRSGGQQILCVSRGASMCVLACVCVCGTVLDMGQESHLLSCHSLWPKNHKWGLVDSWPGACCRRRGERWDFDVISSSDNIAEKVRKLALMCSVRGYVLLIFESIFMMLFLCIFLDLKKWNQELASFSDIKLKALFFPLSSTNFSTSILLLLFKYLYF